MKTGNLVEVQFILGRALFICAEKATPQSFSVFVGWFLDKQGYNPTHSCIAAKAGVAREKVSIHMKKLVEIKILEIAGTEEVKKGQKHKKIYRLHPQMKPAREMIESKEDLKKEVMGKINNLKNGSQIWELLSRYNDDFNRLKGNKFAAFVDIAETLGMPILEYLKEYRQEELTVPQMERLAKKFLAS